MPRYRVVLTGEVRVHAVVAAATEAEALQAARSARLVPARSGLRLEGVSGTCEDTALDALVAVTDPEPSEEPDDPGDGGWEV